MKEKTNPSYNQNCDASFYVSDCFGLDTHNNIQLTKEEDSSKTDFLVNYKLRTFSKTQPQLPPKELHNSSGVVVSLLLSFFLIVFSLKKTPYYFKENFSLLFTDSNLERQQTFKEIFTTYCLYSISLLLISILAFEKITLLQGNNSSSSFGKILTFWAILILFFCAKSILYRLYAYSLNLNKEFKQWMRISSVMMNTFGILVMFPVCVVIYSNSYHNIIINISLIVFLLVQLFLILVVVIHFILKNSDYLYLFVYLCAIELLPYIFIGVLFLNLYKIDFI